MKEESKEEIFEWKNPEGLYRYCIMQEAEIERLNNIINELEKELNKDFTTYLQKDTTMRETGKTYKAGANNYRMHIYLKLQELKGVDKE